MKKIPFILAILLITTTSYAQKIKLKKGDVLLDGKKVMTYDREDWGTQKIHLFSLTDKKEQILMIKNDNETSGYYDDDFLQIKFLQLGEMVELKSKKSWKGIIAWLFKSNIIDDNGMVKEEEIDLFVKNYDENITDRTIRH